MRGKGLLKIVALGLMLACGSAYAAEPATPAPTATTQNEAQNQAEQAADQNVPTSPDIGDAITDWSIGFLAVIAFLFFTAGIWEKRKKKKNGEE